MTKRTITSEQMDKLNEARDINEWLNNCPACIELGDHTYDKATDEIGDRLDVVDPDWVETYDGDQSKAIADLLNNTTLEG